MTLSLMSFTVDRELTGIPSRNHQQITELLRALTRLRVLNLVLWAWKPRLTRLTRLIK